MAEGMFWGEGLRRQRLGSGVQLCSEVRLSKTEKKVMDLETQPSVTFSPAVLGLVALKYQDLSGRNFSNLAVGEREDVYFFSF